jgi:hypothetical protein
MSRENDEQLDDLAERMVKAMAKVMLEENERLRKSIEALNKTVRAFVTVSERQLASNENAKRVSDRALRSMGVTAEEIADIDAELDRRLGG